MSANGKGDAPRPLGVPRGVFEDNWEKAFGPRGCGPRAFGRGRATTREDLKEAERKLGELTEGFDKCNKK